MTQYSFDTKSQGYLASDMLLADVQMRFPDMKKSVLSRIIKFVFPECRKIINKYGYFYVGLSRINELVGLHISNRLLLSY